MQQSRSHMLSEASVKIIRNSLLFKSLPQDTVEETLTFGIKRTFKRGETLFVQGDAANALFVVLDGWVKLGRITPSGDEVVVAVYSKGQSFGEAAALMGGKYPVTVEAAEDCTLFQVAAKPLRDAIQKNPKMATAMLAATFHHLHEFVMEIEDIKGYTGTQRLATFLVTLAPVETGACTFTLPYDKTLIAGRLGMKPESLSRSFAALRKRGVNVVRRKVAVAELDVLHDFIKDERSGGFKAQAAK